MDGWMGRRRRGEQKTAGIAASILFPGFDGLAGMQDATTAPNPTRGRRGVGVEGEWMGTQPDCKAGMIRRPVPFAIICAARIDTNDLVRYIIDQVAESIPPFS